MYYTSAGCFPRASICRYSSLHVTSLWHSPQSRLPDILELPRTSFLYFDLPSGLSSLHPLLLCNHWCLVYRFFCKHLAITQLALQLHQERVRIWNYYMVDLLVVLNNVYSLLWWVGLHPTKSWANQSQQANSLTSMSRHAPRHCAPPLGMARHHGSQVSIQAAFFVWLCFPGLFVQQFVNIAITGPANPPENLATQTIGAAAQ